MSQGTFEHAEKLVKHARAVTAEIYKFAVVLEEDAVEQATKKLNYGRQVLQSLSKLVENPGSMDVPGMRELLYDLIISVRPGLITAIDDLAQRIEKSDFLKIPDGTSSPTITEEEALRNLEEAIDWDAIKAASARPPDSV